MYQVNVSDCIFIVYNKIIIMNMLICKLSKNRYGLNKLKLKK